ncbi:MAG TPA: lamin tail domain-containing protein, partial [Chromatiales bacterium]|nr:lamin tail domain-containing protein [Chromatiales bacterium]
MGYETNPGDDTSNVPYITYDVEDVMYGHYTSAYVRVPFVLTQDQKDRFTTLTLGVRYDDGFVAYLNGEEIHRVGVSGTPGWTSTGASHENRGMEYFDVSDHADALVVGANLLALHGANSSAGSSDFVISAQLTAQEDRPADVSPTALLYNPAHPLDLQASSHIKARARTAEGTWSALAEATFAVGPVAESLRITELMYHPTDPNAEFVELLNIGAEPINLARVRFDEGIDIVFEPLDLDPGEYIVIVADAMHFALQHPDYTGVIAGTYAGRLSNAGERLRLVDALGTVIHEFTYKDGWHPATDGAGFSLTIVDPYNTDLTAWDRKESWRPSALVGGSPGYDDSGLVPPPGSVVINEVLAHSHLHDPDWIELYNTSDEPIHLGGWFLSDSDADDPNRMKYEIAEGTILEPGAYLVFYEDVHFGEGAAGPGTRHETFALSEGGERVHLQSGAGGVLTGYVADEDFGASESDVPFGRYDKPTVSSGYDFVPLESPTPGEANIAPRIGPVILTEIMYRPGSTNDGEEFLELHNTTDAPLLLRTLASRQVSENPNDLVWEVVPWRFTNGIEYTFPP